MIFITKIAGFTIAVTAAGLTGTKLSVTVRAPVFLTLILTLMATAAIMVFPLEALARLCSVVDVVGMFVVRAIAVVAMIVT